MQDRQKQKSSMISTCKYEMVGISEYLPFPICIKLYMRETWYISKKNVAYEDNIITILLDKNGSNSCTSNTWHINIRYFGVKDQLYNGTLTMEYCPTDEMLEELFTKPLQSTLFEIIRRVIMGWDDISLLNTESMS